MKKILFTSMFWSMALCFLSAQTLEGNLPFDINLTRFASGFSSPTDIANAGDDRLFVVERGGTIQVLNADGTKNAEPFLDIDDRVRNSGGQSEQGLLAMTFHPDYPNNGFFYVHYTSNDGNTAVSRFSVDPNDADLALPNSEELIYTAEQPFTNHNGGNIHFGNDGMLYIGLGDGGAGNDPQNLAQDLSSPMGKMLRIDVDNGSPYTIPADNPFINDPNALDEIWALGLRNPWKWSFDRVTGDMWIGDVGQGQWEEVNMQPADSQGGENYGWRCREGANDAITDGCSGTFDEPVGQYVHNGANAFHCSISGGYVYRGDAEKFKQAPPVYVSADYCSGVFFCIYPEPLVSDSFRIVEMNTITRAPISTFGEDINGELYAASFNNGVIYTVEPVCNIDAEFDINAASCDESTDGSISLFGGQEAYYEMSVVNTLDPNTPIDPTAMRPGDYEITLSRFGCEQTFLESVFIIERAPIGFEFDGASMLTVTTFGESYEWFLEGELLEGENTQSIQVSESGNYSVVITEASGCILSSDPFFIEVLSTPSIESITSWELAPNPVTDILQMTLNVNQTDEFGLTILDATGKEIESRTIEVGGKQQYIIDISSYTEGVYIIMLNNGQSTQSRKLVKQ